ncbi:MAG: hypothetical protein K9N51_04150 [Candidatus Pacebacteria bacterium]|nr:hypothetical protein [Candidatus Paceibacterota bacterium]
MPTLQSKRFFGIGNRHDGECYGPVLDSITDSRKIAYRQVTGTRESLCIQAGPDAATVAPTEETYTYSPCFVGGRLVWSQPDGQAWPIYATDDDGRPHCVISVKGRARGLVASAWGDRWILAWEERAGKRTRIRGTAVSIDGQFSEPFDVTDGTYNAYDPSCAVAPDGTLYIAFSAFKGGNYAILLQALDEHGQCIGTPLRVSREGAVCVWPSLHSRAAGGVWVSYTAYQANSGWEYALNGQIDFSFPDHLRRRAQSAFYTNYGLVKAGYIDDGQVWTPQRDFALKTKKGGYTIKDLGIPQTFNSGHSAIFEDESGVPHVLYRKHNSVEKIHYAEEDDLYRSPPIAGRTDPDRNYADLCLSVLDGKLWSDPVRLIQHAFIDDEPISWRLDAHKLYVAFVEDGRTCGNEWNDDKGQMGVGLAEIELDEQPTPSYEPYPITRPPMFGPSMEEPRVRTERGDYRQVFGQTHIHGTTSNCGRSINKDLHLTYRFAQDVQHADFCAITDHAFDMWHTDMLVMRKAAAYYYFPGEFVAIPAYEWTGTGGQRHEGGPFGHVNPMYLEETGDLSVYTPFDTSCAGGTLPKLQAQYADQKIVGIPHHPADPYHPYAWHMHDETFSPVVELFQTARGSYEQPGVPGDNNFDFVDGLCVLDALKRGTRVGFIGGGEHCGLALAGVLVKELTRTGLYEAFRARRTFATSGQLLTLTFSCNGAPMGQEVAAASGLFRLSARAAEPIHALQVIRNGEMVEEVPVNGTEVNHEWTAEQRENGEFWYCRLIYNNNDMAWSSPIWLV